MGRPYGAKRHLMRAHCRTRMAKVEWSPGIEHVSGALAKPSKNSQHSCTSMLLSTHRVAATTSKDCNRLFMRKPTKRSTPVLADEMQRRNRFKSVAQAVQSRMKDLSKIAVDAQNFRAQKDEPSGKKTMKSYLWSLELQTYDASH